MTGKEIFDRHQLAALKNGLGSQEFVYGNVLYQALRLEGEDRIFHLLEQADELGKQVGLGYSGPATEGFGEPDIAVLV